MDVFNDIDEDTAALIIQVQLDDSKELFSRLEGKGKSRQELLTDSQLALQLYKDDLERTGSAVSDRKMTRSIANACQTDGQLLSASLSQEQAAASDREFACKLGGIRTTAKVPSWTVSSEFLDDEIMAKLSALYVSMPKSHTASDTEDNESEGGESSSWAAGRVPSKLALRGCTACQEDTPFYDLARVPCSHEYCRDCLKDLFRSSMTDDSLFPPRCCRETITLGPVRIFLPADLVKQYEAKKIEFDTPDRTYCSMPSCSSFICLDDIAGERATCLACGTVTCTMCKATSHLGDCPADTGLQQVLQTAAENGWQRCFNCHRLVELDVGCNHMTFVSCSISNFHICADHHSCTCRAEFCYRCGLKWKTCGCAQWDENRLIRRAEQLVARRPAAHNPFPQQAQLAAAVQNLRQRHNCEHQSWQYVRGRHQCEECYHTLPSYIFECLQCNIQACNRCRRNRL